MWSRLGSPEAIWGYSGWVQKDPSSFRRDISELRPSPSPRAPSSESSAGGSSVVSAEGWGCGCSVAGSVVVLGDDVFLTGGVGKCGVGGVRLPPFSVQLFVKTHVLSAGVPFSVFLHNLSDFTSKTLDT